MQALRGERSYSSHSLFTLALDGGKWSASHPNHTLPPSTYWIGGWLGLRAGLDIDTREKSFASARDQTKQNNDSLIFKTGVHLKLFTSRLY
jgi:hypothetical protein